MSNSTNSTDFLLWRQEVRKERVRSRLLPFALWTRPGFDAARPHRLLTTQIDRLLKGQTKRLMVFMPPRHGKSELVSRRLPAFFLGKYPDKRVIACSYSAHLATMMNRDCQRIIDSDSYRELFPNVTLATPGARNQRAVRTDEMFEIVGREGSYRATGVGGGITGMGADLLILDDPVKNFDDAFSAQVRDNLDHWYTSTFWTRQTSDARILLTMTRWHDDDIAGRLLRRMNEDSKADQWTVLRLPGLADDNPHPDDDRAPGEPLWPERFGLPYFETARATQGSGLYAGMYQQSPIVAGGNRFKEDWFQQRYTDEGDSWQLGVSSIRKASCTIFITCDPAASAKPEADHTAIGVWAVTPSSDLLLLEMDRGRMGIEAIVPCLKRVCRRWQAEWIAVEANGFQVSIVNEARRIPGLPPIREISHEGKGKLARASPAIFLAEAGQLWLPCEAEWVKPYIDELVRFNGFEDKEDDQVDVTAYAVWQMRGTQTVEDTRVSLGEYTSNAEANGMWGR